MIDPSRSAAHAGIRALYHYEKFRPEHLITVLREKKIYFSDTSCLNDPWDCRPWFDHERMSADEAVESVVDMFFSGSPTDPARVETVIQNAIRTNPGYRRDALQGFSQAFVKMIPDRWRIYCLTPIPDSTLMWSHYGGNHRGICLEFGTDTPLFARAISVAYRREYPEWSPRDLAADPAQILLTKSDDWAYECEYRIILGLGDSVSRSAEFQPLTLTDSFMPLPSGALKSVIIGCEANFDTVARIIESEAPQLQIKTAIRSPNQYRLLIKNV